MPNLRLNRTKSLKHSCDAHVANFSRKSVNDTPLSSFKQVCGICNSDFSQSGDCIECLLCKSGFHASCVSLTRKVLELISTAGDCIKWFCPLCVPKENCDNLKDSDDKVDSRFKNLNDKIDTIEKKSRLLGLISCKKLWMPCELIWLKLLLDLNYIFLLLAC